MKDVDFFIVGAPKCGTTALAYYLSQHPDIFVSDPKEPLYYLDELDLNRKIKDKKHYQVLFRNALEGQLTGEASVWYLYSRTAMQKIKSEYPQAKIIIMSRAPADFVASLHSQLVFGGWETEEVLTSAWCREKERLEAIETSSLRTIEEIPNWRMAYPELALHNKYISMYKQCFGEDQIMVIDHADMKSNTQQAYENCLKFLGVALDNRSDFPVMNSNKLPRSKVVRDLLYWIGTQYWLMNKVRILKSILGIRTFGVYEIIKNKNVKTASRTEVSQALKNDIEEYVRNRKKC